jgi:hypothetical protein
MKGIFSAVLSAVCCGIGSAQSVSSISPSAADAGQVLPVTISGSGFEVCTKTGSMTTCNPVLNSCSLNPVSGSIAASSLSVYGTGSASATFYIPAYAMVGMCSVSPGSASFSIQAACDSLIDSIQPKTATAGNRVTVTIYSLHAHFMYVQSSSAAKNVSVIQLSQGTAVLAADSFRVSSSFVCTGYFTLPDTLAGGKWDLTVVQTLGRPSVVIPGGLFIWPLPKILSLVPDSGARGQQVSMSISGHHTNFMAGTPEVSNVTSVSLLIGGQLIPAQSYSPLSDTLLTALFTIPLTATPGSGSLIVGQGGGYLTATAADGFLVTPSTGYMPTLRIIGADTLHCNRNTLVSIGCTNAHFMRTDSLLSNIDSIRLFSNAVTLAADTMAVTSDSLLVAGFNPPPTLGSLKLSLRIYLKSGYSPLVLDSCLQAIGPLTISNVPDTFIVDSTYGGMPRASGGLGGSLAWSLLKNPAGMTLAHDTLAWKPAALHPAGDPLALRVANTNGEADTLQKLLWTRALPLCIATAIPDTFAADSTYRIVLHATCGQGGSITWSLLKMPAGMTLSYDTLLWKATAVQASGDTLEVRVADTNNEADTLVKIVRTGLKTGTLARGKRIVAPMSVKTFSSGCGGFIAEIVTGTESVRARLYDLKGSLLRNWTLAGEQTVRLRVSEPDLVPGLMVLQVESKGKTLRLPVMVE